MEAAPISTQANTDDSPRALSPSGRGAGLRWLGGLRPLSGLTLFSVGALVISISLSLLGDVAAHENERDALHTLVLLREGWAELPEGDAGSGRVRAKASLAALSEGQPELLGRMRDYRWADSETLLRHGYLFWAAPGSGVLLAWPANHGRSGATTYAVELASGARWFHPGTERWSGLEARPEPPGAEAATQIDGSVSGWSHLSQ